MKATRKDKYRVSKKLIHYLLMVDHDLEEGEAMVHHLLKLQLVLNFSEGESFMKNLLLSIICSLWKKYLLRLSDPETLFKSIFVS